MEIEQLGQEIDKTGNSLTIKRTKQLAHSPAYSFFIRQMAELMENGHGFAATTWRDDDCGIIWAEDNGKICAIICYHNHFAKNLKILAIMLTSVAREYRQRGIHQILNRYYEQTAKEYGCAYTLATVNPNNTARLRSCEKDGLEIFEHLLFKKL
jgi:GNAT superfamily N-acetyltransferase